MEQNIGNAISVMLVGMVTVFLILWLVVIIGNLIIRLTNKYLHGTDLLIKKGKGEDTNPDSAGTIAAIVAAVDIVTNGKGHATKITKV